MPARSSFPERHHALVRRTRRGALVAIAGAVFVLVLLAVGVLVWPGLHLRVASVAAALALFVLVGAAASWRDVCVWVQVIPYFETTVGGEDTFLYGRALARHLGEVDALAAAAGVRPLSDFGFADDLLGETLVWHDPVAGLQSLWALRAALAADPDTLLEAVAVDEDLRRIAAKLLRAQKAGSRFCLLLRHGNVTSGQEWEVRKGTAF